MAIWKDPTPAAKPESHRFDPPAPKPEPAASTPPPSPAPIRAVEAAARESIIAADLTIEGKIEGAGHVRIAGKFKGDVRVQGNLTIEQGAKVSGGVTANKVTLAGELNGNVESAQQIELQQTGVVNGDLKTGSLTVAAGSRIRGHVECGWSEKDSKTLTPSTSSTSSASSSNKMESGSAA
ncbi:polymer-forming cytoskeletal protein [Thermomonas sp.]|uniref:bactofilin family protein n=1 Tax=Thermomonas sp. TaxID=1971895 RepID=UPI0031F2FE4C